MVISHTLVSLLHVSATFLLSILLGFGISYLLLSKSVRRYAFILSPAIGYAVFTLLTIVISSNFDIAVNVSIWPAFVLLLALSIWAGAQLVRQRETIELWQTSKWALCVLPVMLLVVFWPAFTQGLDLFLGTTNPDFYQSLSYFEALINYNLSPLAHRPDVDVSFNPFLATFPDALQARFQAVMFGVLDNGIFGQSPKSTLMSCIIMFSLCVPLTTFFFSKVVLGLGERVALATALMMALSSPVSMSFISILVGQNSGMALLPLTLSVCYLAIKDRDWKMLFLACLLINAFVWIYTMMLPYVLLPVGLFALYKWWADGEKAGKWFLLVAASLLLSLLILRLGIISESVQFYRDLADLLGGAKPLQSFVNYLTEESVGYLTGVAAYPVGSSYLVRFMNDFAPVNLILQCVTAFSLMILGFYFYSLWGWSKQASKDRRVFILIALSIYVAVYVFYSGISLYGYAIFKMVSWLNFFFVPFIIFGLYSALCKYQKYEPSGQGGLGTRLSYKGKTLILVFIGSVFIVGNLISTVDYGVNSLGDSKGIRSTVISYGIGGNRDFPELEKVLPQFIKPDEIVSIGLSNYISNLWAAYYINRSGIKTAMLSHDDFPIEDAFLPDMKTNLTMTSSGEEVGYKPRFHIDALADYYLLPGDGNLNPDIIEGLPPVEVVWKNNTFKLVKANAMDGILITGRGLYQVEYFNREKISWWWPETMRWTSEGWELMLFHPSSKKDRYRLSFLAIPGIHREIPRNIEIWLNNNLIGEIEINGAARVVSESFGAVGPIDKLVVKVKDKIKSDFHTRRGLWNRDVAMETRQINLAVAEVKLLHGDDVSTPFFGRGSFKISDLIEHAYRLDGFSLDGWVGEKGMFSLPVKQSVTKMTLKLEFPGWAGFEFPFKIAFKVNGHLVEKVVDVPGLHSFSFDYLTGHLLTVEILPSQHSELKYVGLVSALLKEIELH